MGSRLLRFVTFLMVSVGAGAFGWFRIPVHAGNTAGNGLNHYDIFVQAQSARREGRYLDAARLYGQVYFSNPESSWSEAAYFHAAECHYLAGHGDKAAQLLIELMSLYPDSSYLDGTQSLYYRITGNRLVEPDVLARIDDLIARHRYEVAIDVLLNQYFRAGAEAEVLDRLNRCYMALNRFEEAAVWLEELLTVVPDIDDRNEIYRRLAKCYSASGAIYRSKEIARRITDMNHCVIPGTETDSDDDAKKKICTDDLLIRSALKKNMQGNYSEALNILRQLDGEKKTDVFWIKGFILWKQGQLTEAGNAFRKAREYEVEPGMILELDAALRRLDGD